VSKLNKSLLLKKIFDFSASLFLIIFLLPLFVIVSFFILFSIGKPIFFLQERIGFKGQSFKIIKFRTMKIAFKENGEPLEDNLRLTKLTSIIRSLSLDEIPALFNVIKGEMSLVGPRPYLEEYRNEYDEIQFSRHDSIPGITGLAQINGRNTISWEEKFTYDIQYIKNRTFTLDIYILLVTLIKILTKDGINQDSDTTMEKFVNKRKENEQKFR